MVSMFLNRCRMRADGRLRPVALKTDNTCWLDEVSRILCSVHVMAARAHDSSCVHNTLHKIVALHPVFVRGSVREMRESCLPEFVGFQFPVLCKVRTDMKADRPVVVFALNRVRERLALAMALNADVICPNRVETCGIHNGGAARTLYMRGARSVTPFTSDVPL